MDLPLATWLLSALTFVVGVLAPMVYRRLSYDGVSVKQPFQLRAVLHSQDRAQLVLFATVIKLANARKDSLLLDGIDIPATRVGDVTFSPIDVLLRFREDGDAIYLPLDTEPNYRPDWLPIIVKPDEARNIALEVHFSYDPTDTPDPAQVLAPYVEQHGLTIGLRINGKYRPYSLRIKPTDPRLAFGLPKGRSEHDSERDADTGTGDIGSAASTRAGFRNFEGADFDASNFESANLKSSTFEGADMAGAKFEGANLKGSTFEGADMRGANFDGARLEGSNLRRD